MSGLITNSSSARVLIFSLWILFLTILLHHGTRFVFGVGTPLWYIVRLFGGIDEFHPTIIFRVSTILTVTDIFLLVTDIYARRYHDSQKWDGTCPPGLLIFPDPTHPLATNRHRPRPPHRPSWCSRPSDHAR